MTSVRMMYSCMFSGVKTSQETICYLGSLWVGVGGGSGFWPRLVRCLRGVRENAQGIPTIWFGSLCVLHCLWTLPSDPRSGPLPAVYCCVGQGVESLWTISCCSCQSIRRLTFFLKHGAALQTLFQQLVSLLNPMSNNWKFHLCLQ